MRTIAAAPARRGEGGDLADHAPALVAPHMHDGVERSTRLQPDGLGLIPARAPRASSRAGTRRHCWHGRCRIPGVTSVEGGEKIANFGAAAFADDDAIRPHPKGLPDEHLQVDPARPRRWPAAPPAGPRGMVRVQLSDILDEHDPLRGGTRLSSALSNVSYPPGAPADQERRPPGHEGVQHSATPADGAGSDESRSVQVARHSTRRLRCVPAGAIGGAPRAGATHPADGHRPTETHRPAAARRGREPDGQGTGGVLSGKPDIAGFQPPPRSTYTALRRSPRRR